tara:strand:- start:455 stop:676 length:222 start_codon:yes stop_codon:yes gene_type:complete
MIESRITKEEAFSFLLTYIVVDQGRTVELDPVTLFNLMRIAGEAELVVNREDGVIPHEVIEEAAKAWIAELDA